MASIVIATFLQTVKRKVILIFYITIQEIKTSFLHSKTRTKFGQEIISPFKKIEQILEQYHLQILECIEY